MAALSLLANFWSLPANATSCVESPWIRVWPSYDVPTIRTRQIFLLFADQEEGYLQKGLRQFGTEAQLYLWSAKDSVPFRVLDRVLDEKGKMQLLLQPNRSLLAGHEYELRASRGQENLFYYFEQPPASSKSSGKTRYRWKALVAMDWQSPVWMSSPQVLKKVYENCASYSNSVLFSCPVRDSSSYLIKMTVQHQTTSRHWSAYQIPVNRTPWKHQIWMGNGSCGGNVRFESENNYEVAFEAVDSIGNRASAGSSPLVFQSPKRVECSTNLQPKRPKAKIRNK
ncbi:hypothetical protein [Hymenobacter glacialis]|uniref:hypothetical protein n=1 Tax=Hymenobacter glacialis TaxID=1908236 RepID=UPI000F79C2FF|nr:hypothetical protein [Hymenobacter glacialis]